MQINSFFNLEVWICTKATHRPNHNRSQVLTSSIHTHRLLQKHWPKGAKPSSVSICPVDLQLAAVWSISLSSLFCLLNVKTGNQRLVYRLECKSKSATCFSVIWPKWESEWKKSVPVAQWLEHCVSSAKVVGSIPREHIYWQYKCIAWMHCKSLWIKASAKCINVNVGEREKGAHVNMWRFFRQ